MVIEDGGRKELNELLVMLGRAIDEDESGVHVTNPTRMEEFLACGKAMKQLFSGAGTKVIISPHDMYPSVGTIKVVTRRLCLDSPEAIELFTLASGIASNYEIYPKLDGTIVLAFAFYGLTKKMKE